MLCFVGSMPGRKDARRLGDLPGSTWTRHRGSAFAGALASTLVVAPSSCGFPDYSFHAPSAGAAGHGAIAGGGGSSGSLGGASVGGGADDAGAAGTTGGAGDAGSGIGGEAGVAGGSGGSGGSGGLGGAACVYPTPVVFPAHCFNHTVGNGESGTDCGGADCAPCSGNQACTQASDCLSQQCASNKTCVPLISLSYLPIDTNAQTPAPKFMLSLTYLDSAKMNLQDLTIRYYYTHADVTEPIIGLESQATIDPGNSQTDISQAVRTSVHRFPLGPAQNQVSSDSYFEIAFDKSMVMTTGTKIVITQYFIAGSADPPFDQNGHYSFVNSNTAIANEAITVHRAGQRLWGVPPPLAVFPSCAFAFGVNMNGPALVVGGAPLLAEGDAQLTFKGGAAYANTSKPLPITDTSTTSLLGTGRTLNTADSAVWPMPNGKYWAYAWLTSTVSDTGTLKFGQRVADPFIGKTLGGARWGLIGPYSVDVVDGSLTLAVAGSAHVAGVMLYAAQR